VNEGLLSLPLAFPGTALHRAIQAKSHLLGLLKKCVAQSKQCMSTESDPRCLLDLFWWMQSKEHEQKNGQLNTTLQLDDSSQDNPNEPKKQEEEEIDMASVLFDFLFASQDLTTSALVWCLIILEQQPEILQKIVEEQGRLRPNDEELNLEILGMMKFTRNFAYEVLRFRPPASFVPLETLNDVPITSDVVVPKGSLVVPSIWATVPEAFPSITQLSTNQIPNRLKDENYSVFGKGSHSCLGKQFAINLIVTFLAVLCSNCTWKRHTTGRSNELVLLPALYPADCILSFQFFKKES